MFSNISWSDIMVILSVLANGFVIESKWFIRSESSICVRGGSKIDNEFYM